MKAMPELIVKSPDECSNVELGAFIAFIRAGGEVSIQGLSERIFGAATLAFARVDGLVVGVAALKRPQASYRRRVSIESGAALSAQELPFELGWVYVLPELRGKGFSLLLSQAALADSNGAGVFATSRTDNIAMHRSLAKLGFVATGNPFASGRGKHSVQVFIRLAALPGGAAPLN
jgi:GNAT superfamily N-acetyltransferase